MATSLISTGVQFPDATIQTTAATGGGDYIMRTYTSSTTWSKPAGLKAVKVTVVGGGGGGGTTYGAYLYPAAAVPGGGGGGMSIEYIPAGSIPGPVSVTVGAGGGSHSSGGTSSFGAFLSATGGSGGAYYSNPGYQGPSYADGGAGSGGDINIPGSASFNAITQTAALGQVGPALGGFSAMYATSGSYSNQGSASGFGNAGNGRGYYPGSYGTYSGGSGAAGVVIVEEFY